MPERFFLILPASFSFRDLTDNERRDMERRLAWNFDCRKVTVHSDPLHARRGWIDVYRDPEPPEPDHISELGPWPGTDSFSQPIPVGVAKRSGNPVTLTMVTETGCRNILFFGEPGSGKSAAAAMLGAAAALDPTVTILGADGGMGTDLAWLRGRMAEYEVLPEKVFLMLRNLDTEIKRRGEEMAAAGRRKIDPGDPKILVIMEEFPTFTDEKVKRSFRTGLPGTSKDDPGETMMTLQARCMRLGRKYGISFLCIAQVPTVDAVPGKLRRLFQYRWGFRTLEPVAWRAGFGGGVPFVKLNIARAGHSVLMADGAVPVEMRAFYLSDEELEEIAADSSLAPVDSPAPDTEAIPADLCLENRDSPVAPTNLSDSGDAAPSAAPVAPDAAPYEPDAWDLAVLTAARFYPRTGPDLYNIVGSLSAGAARKRLVALERARLLSSPPRVSVTDPKLYLTTLDGRTRITAAEVSNIPDGVAEVASAESGSQPT